MTHAQLLQMLLQQLALQQQFSSHPRFEKAQVQLGNSSLPTDDSTGDDTVESQS